MTIKEKFSKKWQKKTGKKVEETIFGDEAENRAKEKGQPTLSFNIFKNDGGFYLYVEGDLDGANIELMSKALTTLFKAYGVNCSQEFCLSTLKDGKTEEHNS